MKLCYFSFIFSFLMCSLLLGQEKLVLMGGGPYPDEAAKQFVVWAGNETGKLLLLPWATDDPKAEFEEVKSVLQPFKPASIEQGIAPGEAGYDKAVLLKQIEMTTGVFFPGGDQVVLMKHMNLDREIREKLLCKFRSGTVFGGYSAGTAIMSQTMITGNGDFTVIDPEKVETAPGFGLVRNVVVDQHFVARQRQNRLISVMQKSSETVGLGIDEGTALLIEGGTKGRVVGSGYVMGFRKKPKSIHEFDLVLLAPGSEIILQF